MTDWSRDGNCILVDKSPADIWVIPIGGNRKPFKFIDGTQASERVARFSPNVKWVAYQSNETDRGEIYVCRFPGCDQKVPISTAGGAQPSWSDDGKELYWIAPDGSLMVAGITERADSIEPAPPIRLFPTHIYLGRADNPFRNQYAVAPDGRILINTVVGDEAWPPIIVIHNWRGK